MIPPQKIIGKPFSTAGIAANPAQISGIAKASCPPGMASNLKGRVKCARM
jgi:hypothetical protein